MDARCSNCKWCDWGWSCGKPDYYTQDGSRVLEVNYRFGLCRYNPPTHKGFPEVVPDDWCRLWWETDERVLSWRVVSDHWELVDQSDKPFASIRPDFDTFTFATWAIGDGEGTEGSYDTLKDALQSVRDIVSDLKRR